MWYIYIIGGFPSGSVVKNLPANAEDAGDVGSLSGLGRCSGEGNDNPIQYSCLENPMDSGAWRTTVHEITDSQEQLSIRAFSIHNRILLSH